MVDELQKIFLIYIDEIFVIDIILNYKKQLEKFKKKRKKSKNNKKRKRSERRLLRIHHINMKLNYSR